jgi:hypothetical protein
MTIAHLPLDPPVTADQHYFTLSELRDEQDMPPTYPDAAITPNQALAEQVIEHACGVAFLPRQRTETLAATSSGFIHLTQPLARNVEALNDGTDWTPQQLATVTIHDGYITGTHWTAGTLVTVTYTHGYDTPPLRIRRAAMIATRVWTTRGPVDDRATQIAADGATVNLATPGLMHSVTGIPEVDATITQHYWHTNIG